MSRVCGSILMKTLIALILGAMSILAAVAQEENKPVYDTYPHLNIVSAFGLNGGGYSTFSQKATVGLAIEKPRFLLSVSTGYDNARKTNDNTIGNNDGHTKSIGGSGFYRLNSGWFFGGGSGWAKLSTTNYTKDSWHPSFGGGKDIFLDRWSFRLKCTYSLQGSDKDNGVQGPTLTFILPSPVTKHHFFFYESLNTSIFHATITDPTNKALTDLQRADRSYASFLTLGMMFKF